MQDHSITGICRYCGRSFTVTATRRLSCSRACQHAYQRAQSTALVSLSCDLCGAILQVYQSKVQPRNFCNKVCYDAFQRQSHEDLERRLLAHRQIDPETGCWLWTAGRNPAGYGKMRYRGKTIVVPRLAAHAWLGFDLDSELFICHTCDNPPCFNPKHLFPGTCQDNADDSVRKGRNAQQQGEKHGGAKLTEAQVRQIRILCDGGMLHKDVAKLVGISRPAVSLIAERKTWKHLP